MKKTLRVLFGVFLLVVLVGCGAKTETDTFSQSPMTGTKVSIIVEHEGDKVTKVSGKAVMDNEVLQITDEDMAKEVAKSFEESSGLGDAEMKYTEKETIITFDAPDESVGVGASFKEGEEALTEIGFEKE
ncbi:DUF1307 domain-containing protein [Enterococcus sp. LJL128]|uniref:DUF1307 domain-containing protein n=1 Tax=Enterococcus sp. LJL51 TaxID=3416656 RepID=UPI003CF53F2E